jgi:hypothetical protein
MSDEDIVLEKVLAGMRDAEPSPGFERRILAGLEAHQARRHYAWWWPALALACGLIAALIHFLWIPAPLPVPPITTVAVEPEQALPPPPTRAVMKVRTRRPGPPHSAAPLPLTQQEKLLLRLAHHPEDATILNPVAREAQSATATTEFQHFFQMDDAEMRSQRE